MHDAKYHPEALADYQDQQIAGMEADMAHDAYLAGRPVSNKDRWLEEREAEHEAEQRERRRDVPRY